MTFKPRKLLLLFALGTMVSWASAAPLLTVPLGVQNKPGTVAGAAGGTMDENANIPSFILQDDLSVQLDLGIGQLPADVAKNIESLNGFLQTACGLTKNTGIEALRIICSVAKVSGSATAFANNLQGYVNDLASGVTTDVISELVSSLNQMDHTTADAYSDQLDTLARDINTAAARGSASLRTLLRKQVKSGLDAQLGNFYAGKKEELITSDDNLLAQARILNPNVADASIAAMLDSAEVKGVLANNSADKLQRAEIIKKQLDDTTATTRLEETALAGAAKESQVKLAVSSRAALQTIGEMSANLPTVLTELNNETNRHLDDITAMQAVTASELHTLVQIEGTKRLEDLQAYDAMIKDAMKEAIAQTNKVHKSSLVALSMFEQVQETAPLALETTLAAQVGP